MAKHHYKNKQQRNFSFNSNKYVEPISKILDFDSAGTEDITIGVEAIELLVKNNSDVKTHQIRRLFSLIKSIDDTRGLIIERPHVKYIGAGQRSKGGKNIVEVIDKLIEIITTKKDEEKNEKEIKGLKYIMESIVAYHKFYSKE